MIEVEVEVGALFSRLIRVGHVHTNRVGNHLSQLLRDAVRGVAFTFVLSRHRRISVDAVAAFMICSSRILQIW